MVIELSISKLLICNMQKLNKLVLATSNKGKIREIETYLNGLALEIIPQTELGVIDIEETANSFVENAILKARNACAQTNLPAIADDSGLIIDALNGEPGIYSARYASSGDFTKNINKVLANLENVPAMLRGAKFYCVMIFMEHAKDPQPKIFTGTWVGSILTNPIGSNGFGYDSIFFVPKYKCSAAELDPSIKNKISHRGQALTQLIKFFRSDANNK